MKSWKTKEPGAEGLTKESPEGIRRRQRLPKKVVIITIWVIVLLLVVGLLGYGLYEWKIKPGKRFAHSAITSRTERMDAAGTRYCQYGGYLLKYNRDGVSVLDGTERILWTAAYNMQNPIVAMAGAYVAVADAGAKQLFVYDEKGNATELEILSDILQISLSEQGEVAVLMQEDGANRIQIYDAYAAGDKKKVEILTYEEKDGYALSIALSKDGAKLVTSYFQVSGNRLDSNLTFYSFSGIGQGSNADRIVGIFPYEDAIFTELAFLDNDTVCAAGESQLEVFSMRQTPDLLWSMEYKQKVSDLYLGQEYIALLTETESGGNGGIFLVYGKDGSKEAERTVEFDSIGIGIRGDDFFAYSENECLIMRPGGKVKYEGQFQDSAQYMLAGRASDQFFLVTGQYIEEMRLKERTEE